MWLVVALDIDVPGSRTSVGPLSTDQEGADAMGTWTK